MVSASTIVELSVGEFQQPPVLQVVAVRHC